MPFVFARKDALGAADAPLVRRATFIGCAVCLAELLDIVEPLAISIPDGDGRVALHFARAPQVAELLLAHRADPATPDSAGMTPVHVAAFNSRASVLRLLLAHGADPDLPDASGSAALHHANSAAAIVSLLLEARASPRAIDARGR